ncbi:MAG: hypothetical protein IRY87_35805, partial [Acetobacteraceae bacterium]|nr:hypothetical protein [Acetobacteraceae bacterium]
MTGQPCLLPADGLGSRRFLALHLPCLATDRIRRAEPDLPTDQPLATWAASGSRR